MHLVQKSKQVFSILLMVLFCAGLLIALAAPAQAAEILPEDTYIAQSRGGVCTLASSTMLVRSTVYLNGSSHWSEITESDVGSVAWRSGAGLVFEWTYQTDYASVSVRHEDLSGISEKDLKALLDDHPEGIVFYCIGCPHAVFLTDYEDGVFYCGDPAPGYAGERIPLADSWTGRCYGYDQDTVLANASAYWYVADCSVTPDMDEIPLDALGLRKLPGTFEVVKTFLNEIGGLSDLVTPAVK